MKSLIDFFSLTNFIANKKITKFKHVEQSPLILLNTKVAILFWREFSKRWNSTFMWMSVN